MSDGDSVDGIPLNDDSNSYDPSDSEDDDYNDTVSGSGTANTAANAKSIPVNDCNKQVLDKKPEQKGSGFSMTFSSSAKPNFSAVQSSAAIASCGSKNQETSVANDITSVKTAAEIGAIKIKIGSQKSKDPPPQLGVKRSSDLVAKAFNPDEESDDEEMPPEAKMRMRNIGKDTPTAEGPNSFSKGKLGFCNRQKAFQRELDQFSTGPTKKKL